MRPEIGITHIATERSAATETGSAAFALTVQEADHDVTFVDGGITLKGGTQTGATFRPWVQAGVRHQLDGNRAQATAGFTGAALNYTLPSVTPGKTLAVAGAGASADLGANVSLYAAYQGEFGEGRGHNVNLGVRIGF